MNEWPKNRIVFVGIVILVILAGLLFVYFSRRPDTSANAVTLTVWGTDPKPYFDTLTSSYSAFRPNATVKYSQIDADKYDNTLITAFARGEGPDAFMIGNHEVLAKSVLLIPATSTQYTISQAAPLYPKAVATDMFLGNQIFALPLYMDTLALVYNKDLFDQAGIATPPATWQEVLDIIPRLRKVNAQGQLTLAAAALGGGDQNIPHATDLLSLTMLQNGAVLSNASGRAQFANDQKAEAALRFYADFANPSSAAYAWSDGLGKALDNFAAGKLAMMFGYHDDLAAIRAKSPFLDFAVAPMPQITSEAAVNFPGYEGLAVWRGSKRTAWAWDFAIFAATDQTANQKYLLAANRPPALRSLISTMQGNPELNLFARQSLTAQSWLMPDYAKVKTIMSGAIMAAVAGADLGDALTDAVQKINQLSR